MVYAQRTSRYGKKKTRYVGTKIKRRAWKVSKSISSPLYPIRVKRTASIDSFTTSAVADTLKAYSFKLSQIPGYADFVAMFDSYRIDKVVVRMMPYRSDNYDASSGVYNINASRVFHVVDLDDDTAPTTLAELQEYATCITTMAKYSVKRVIKPKIAQLIYNGVTNAYATPLSGTKLDLAYPTVPHYGFKVGMNASAVAGAFGYDVLVDYYVSLFGIR